MRQGSVVKKAGVKSVEREACMVDESGLVCVEGMGRNTQ